MITEGLRALLRPREGLQHLGQRAAHIDASPLTSLSVVPIPPRPESNSWACTTYCGSTATIPPPMSCN